MDLYKRLLVCLDLSDLDKDIFKFLSQLVNTTNVEKVYFINVTESLDLPEEITDKYPSLLAPVDEAIQKQISSEVDDFLEIDNDLEHRPEFETLVREGNVVEHILKEARRKDVDLILLGRKRETEDDIYILKKCVRVAHCSIVLVPKNITAHVSNLMVPIDFSEKCAEAIRTASSISGVHRGSSLLGVHFYRVPSGYSKIGKSYEEFAEIMLRNAKKESQEFLEKFNLEEIPLDIHFELRKGSVADQIFEFAQSHEADGLIMASKGRAFLASIVLGSVAERVLDHDHDIPLLIVKDKKENMGLFDAIARI